MHFWHINIFACVSYVESLSDAVAENETFFCAEKCNFCISLQIVDAVTGMAAQVSVQSG